VESSKLDYSEDVIITIPAGLRRDCMGGALCSKDSPGTFFDKCFLPQ